MKNKLADMTLEEIFESISKIEYQEKQTRAEIYRLPIAGRFQAIAIPSLVRKENELYEMLDQLERQRKKYTTSEQYLKWTGDT